MVWPKELLETLQKADGQARLLAEEESPEPRVTIVGLSEEDLSDSILLSWSLESLTSRQMNIKLEFKNPVQISQGYTPDILILVIELSKFKDVNGQSLEENAMFRILIPPQFAS